MTQIHLVQIGVMGRVGRFTSPAACYPRRCRVICRTVRGLEMGRVLTTTAADLREIELADGEVIRAMTVQDELLQARLEKNKRPAMTACHLVLQEKGILTPLLDAEHLFDGRSLFFYFLGEVTNEIEAALHDLTQVYEKETGYHEFAQLLTAGCGPDCGTDLASGCTTGGCATCAVAAACSTKHAKP